MDGYTRNYPSALTSTGTTAYASATPSISTASHLFVNAQCTTWSDVASQDTFGFFTFAYAHEALSFTVDSSSTAVLSVTIAGISAVFGPNANVYDQIYYDGGLIGTSDLVSTQTMSSGTHTFDVYASSVTYGGGAYRDYNWASNNAFFTLDVVSPVPEPCTMVAVGTGVLAVLRRRRRQS